MYETLVKIMRHCVETCDCPTCPVDDKARAKYCITSTFAQAADAIEELSKQLDDMNEANIALYGALPKWIPVTERLPENGVRCLVTRFDFVTNTPFIDLLWFDNSWWDRLNSGEYAVTHWMPLPQAPKEE